MISKPRLPRILTGLVLILIITNFTGFVFSGLLTAPATAATLASQITVTFDPCNGEPAFQIQTMPGITFPQPADPVRTGYTFKGWYTEPDGAGGLFGQPVLTDVTVYANWEINRYFIVFSPNMLRVHWYHDYDVCPERWGNWQTYGSIIQMPTFNLTYYDLTGWNTKPDGSGEMIDAGKIITGHLDLYAQWQARPCAVKLYDWDGTFLDQVSIAYDQYMDYPTHPVRQGYDFVDWHPSPHILGDCSLTARYELIPIMLKPESSYIKSYEYSLLSNIPYGTTPYQLLANLQNERSLLRVTNSNEVPITNQNAILHTGNRLQLVINGKVMETCYLKITDDPAIERPVGPEPESTPLPTGSATPRPTSAESSVAEPTPSLTVETPTTTPAATSSSTEPHSPAPTIEPATTSDNSATVSPPPGDTPSPATLIIGGSAIGSTGLLSILAILKRTRLPKPPPIEKL